MGRTIPVEHIDMETGEVTYGEQDLKIVDLESQTRLHREMRAMVKREYRRLGETYGMSLEETLRMTAGIAQLVAKSAVNEALRALAEDLKPKQAPLPLPEARS